MGRLLLFNSMNRRFIIIGLGLLMALLLIIPISVSAETPILKVQGNDLAPKIIYLGESYSQSQNDIVMLHISLNTTYDDGLKINSITFHRAGQSSDSAVKNISLYEDTNHNSQLDPENDTLLSSSEFVLGKAELPLGKTVKPADPLDILVTVDISSEAASGGTLGFDIPKTDYIEVDSQAIVEFEHPISSKNSSIELDTDGDLNPDSTDPDDDNDRYMDDMEIAAGSDSKDESSLPLDTDSDFVPDIIDTDDDNDGVPDKYDDFPLDKDKQRDYQIVMIYMVIAIILIIIIMLIVRSKKSPIKDIDSKKNIEDEGEFDLKGEKIHEDLEAKILDEEDEELMDEA